jgi:hypothetical protein
MRVNYKGNKMRKEAARKQEQEKKGSSVSAGKMKINLRFPQKARLRQKGPPPQ